MINIYNHYKVARDTAWETLIHCQISTLPIDLNLIAQAYDITIRLYSQCTSIDPQKVSEDGFSTNIDGTKTIYINSEIATIGRRRFTLAHELGHCLLGHQLDGVVARTSEHDSTDYIEQQANVFARDILMPACVLNAIGAYTPEEIAEVCNISIASATIRANRLDLLRKRDKFGVSPLERQVLEQFKRFIDERER